MNLIQVLNEGALDLGYIRFGAMKIYAMNGYEALLEKMPWIKSIMIGAFHYNIYKLPEENLINLNLHEVFKSRFVKNTFEYETASNFENLLRKHQVNFAHGMTIDLKTVEKLALEMRIGLYRKNNHFYTEEGSYVYLHVWLTDLETAYINEDLPSPCPDHCSRCIRNCPVSALEKGYGKNEERCLIHEVELIQERLNNKVNIRLPYIKGCHMCLDVCPYNDGRWEEIIPFEVS